MLGAESTDDANAVFGPGDACVVEKALGVEVLEHEELVVVAHVGGGGGGWQQWWWASGKGAWAVVTVGAKEKSYTYVTS